MKTSFRSLILASAIALPCAAHAIQIIEHTHPDMPQFQRAPQPASAQPQPAQATTQAATPTPQPPALPQPVLPPLTSATNAAPQPVQLNPGPIAVEAVPVASVPADEFKPAATPKRITVSAPAKKEKPAATAKAVKAPTKPAPRNVPNVRSDDHESFADYFNANYPRAQARAETEAVSAQDLGTPKPVNAARTTAVPHGAKVIRIEGEAETIAPQAETLHGTRNARPFVSITDPGSLQKPAVTEFDKTGVTKQTAAQKPLPTAHTTHNNDKAFFQLLEEEPSQPAPAPLARPAAPVVIATPPAQPAPVPVAAQPVSTVTPQATRDTRTLNAREATRARQIAEAQPKRTSPQEIMMPTSAVMAAAPRTSGLPQPAYVPEYEEPEIIPPPPAKADARSGWATAQSAQELTMLSPAAGGAQPAPRQAAATETTVAALLPPAARTVASGNGRALRSQFTSGIQNLEPVDQLTALSGRKANKLNYFTELSGLTGQTVTHQWHLNDKPLLEKRMVIGSENWRVWSSASLKAGVTGELRVSTVTANGEVVREEVLTLTK